MKKLSIYEVYVLMQGQETCDRMKQLCIDNGLTIWSYKMAFSFSQNEDNYFEYDDEVGFGIFCGLNGIRIDDDGYSQVTETEFIELLKEYKNA